MMIRTKLGYEREADIIREYQYGFLVVSSTDRLYSVDRKGNVIQYYDLLPMISRLMVEE